MTNISKLVMGFFLIFCLLLIQPAQAQNSIWNPNTNNSCDMSDYVVTKIEGVEKFYDDTTWPISVIRISDPYGPRTLPSRPDFHKGIDLQTGCDDNDIGGDIVYAIADGEVTRVQQNCSKNDPDCPYPNGGNTVVIKHEPDNVSEFKFYYSIYQHLADFETGNGGLSEGGISKGSRIGHLGETDATYPHLHLDIRTQKSYQENSVNPLYFLNNNSLAYINKNDYQVCVTKKPELTVKFISPRTELDFNEIQVIYGRIAKTINLSTRAGFDPNNIDNPIQNNVEIIPHDFKKDTPEYVIEFKYHQLTDFDEINIKDIWGNGRKIVPKK